MTPHSSQSFCGGGIVLAFCSVRAATSMSSSDAMMCSAVDYRSAAAVRAVAVLSPASVQ